jgi:hypothetical protein
VTCGRLCQSCLLSRSCPYAYIFICAAAPPGAQKIRRYEAVARPFALRVGRFSGDPPGCDELFLTLFGEGNLASLQGA